MKTRTLDALDFRDEVPCEHCFVDRLKRAFDDRYIACKPEFELLIVTPEQHRTMRKLVDPQGDIPGLPAVTSWWGVPISVQER